MEKQKQELEKLNTLFSTNKKGLAKAIIDSINKNPSAQQLTQEQQNDITNFVVSAQTQSNTLGTQNATLQGLSNLIFDIIIDTWDDYAADPGNVFKIFYKGEIEAGAGSLIREALPLSADVSPTANFNDTTSSITDLVIGANIKNTPGYEIETQIIANSAGTNTGTTFGITVPMEPGKLAFTSLIKFKEYVEQFLKVLNETVEAWLQNEGTKFVFQTFPITNTITDTNNNTYTGAAIAYTASNVVDYIYNVFGRVIEKMKTKNDIFNADAALNTTTNLWDFSAAYAANKTNLGAYSQTKSRINIAKADMRDYFLFVKPNTKFNYGFGWLSNTFQIKFAELGILIPQENIIPLNKYVTFATGNTQANPNSVPSIGSDPSSDILNSSQWFLMHKDTFIFKMLWRIDLSNMWANVLASTHRTSVNFVGAKRSYANAIQFSSASLDEYPEITA